MPEPLPFTKSLLSPSMGRVLRPLLYLATTASFYFHLREFLSPDYVLAYNPDLAYITLLGAYAGHREVRRWSEAPELQDERAKKGERYVAFWWLFYYVTVISANHVAGYRVPEGLFPLCLQITGIFFGTLTSQQLFTRKDLKSENKAGGPLKAEELVKETLGKASGPLQRRDLEARTSLSRSTLQRLLNRLEAAGAIRWTGKTRNDPDGAFELTHRD